MRKLIALSQEGEVPIYVAVDIPLEDAKDEIRKVGVLDYFKGEPGKVDKKYAMITKTLLAFSKPLIDSFEEMKKEKIPLSKANATFGLSFTGTGNIFLVEASTEASISISLEWDLQ